MIRQLAAVLNGHVCKELSSGFYRCWGVREQRKAGAQRQHPLLQDAVCSKFGHGSEIARY